MFSMDQTMLLAVAATVQASAGLVLVVFRLAHPRLAGVLTLASSALLQALGTVMLAPEHAAAEPWPVFLANILSIGGLCLLLRGTSSVLRRPQPNLLCGLIMLLTLAFAGYFSFIEFDTNYRVFVSALTSAALLADATLLIFRVVMSPAGFELPLLVSGTVFGAFAAFSAFRALIMLFGPRLDTVLDATPGFQWTFYTRLGLAALSSLCFLILAQRGYEKRLATAIDKLCAEIERRKQAEDEMRQQASSDALTKLANRRAATEFGEKLFSTRRRHGEVFSAIIIDLDDFKGINDTLGHPTGDAVLVAVASSLRENTRREDLVARMGGEEMLVLLPKVDLEGAKRVAEKLRSSIESMAENEGAVPVPVTASLGVAEAGPLDEHFSDVVARADRALYLAKRTGKNRVCLSLPSDVADMVACARDDLDEA